MNNCAFRGRITRNLLTFELTACSYELASHENGDEFMLVCTDGGRKKFSVSIFSGHAKWSRGEDVKELPKKLRRQFVTVSSGGSCDWNFSFFE